MKRILVLLVVVLFSIGCSKRLTEFGKEAYNKVDYKKAIQLWQKACDSSEEAWGCNNLGSLYDRGLGVNQDYQKAAQLFQKACDGGEAISCSSLGFLYEYGRGVRQNFSIAKQ